MTKFKNILKRFKAIVIIIVAVIVALANYLLYPIFIKKDMQLIEVPVAVQAIEPGTKISEEMLTSILTNKELIPENIIYSKDELLGKYTKANYTVSANGFFYNDALSAEKEVLGSVYYKLEEGQIAYTIKATEQYNIDSKFSVGQYIDIYYKSLVPQQEGTSYLIGKLDSDVRILALVSSGSETYITLSLKQEDLSHYLVAEEMGTLIPIVDYEANGTFTSQKIYDEASLNEYLEGEAQILLLPETSEEIIETGAIEKDTNQDVSE